MIHNCLKQYSLLVLLLSLLSACQNGRLHEVEHATMGSQTDSEGLITLSTNRSDGFIELSLDAPMIARTGIWIDLNGDGRRPKDGSEDVMAFNAYQKYQLAPGMKEVNIYGDITYFAAAGNAITEVKVDKNQFLTTLHLPMNEIKTIDLSNNRVLKAIDLSNNKIEQIDLSANTALESILLYKNALTELKVAQNMALRALDCSNNYLSSVDVTRNSELESLLVYNNQLTDLNIAQNKRLNKLWLFGNTGINEEQYPELISTLNETTSGSLWLSNDKIDDKLKGLARLSGWNIE